MTSTPHPADRRGQKSGSLRKRESIRRLKEALAEDRLALHYQPIVDLATGRPVSAEALLRWRQPQAEQGTLTDLAAAAEHSPVIFALERWTMDRCCREAAVWQRGPLPGLRVNLNLSAREFQRARLPAILRKAFDRTEMDPARVTLEVTESSAIHHLDDVANTLEEIKDLGVELWLDDFGTGHSSLAWLSRFPIDGVKIPGLFIEDVIREERAAVITATVIEMAHRLRLQVVAEGVEREDQLEFLRGHGCDFAQGFLFYDALPAEELAARLAAAAAGRDVP